MNRNISLNPGRFSWKTALAVFAGAAVVFLMKDALIPASGVAFGGCAVAFLLEPLSRRLEKFLPRGMAAALSLFLAVLTVTGVLLLLLPPMLRQIARFWQSLPASVGNIENALSNLRSWLEEKSLLPLGSGSDGSLNSAFSDLSWLTRFLADAAAGAASFAAGFAGAMAKLVLMCVLGVLFLADRDRLLLKLELCVPRRFRKRAVCAARNVERDLRLYLRGQMTVSLAVSVLSALGLWLAGIPSPLATGAFVGILNVIPYLGPVLGAVPAVLSALSLGIRPALFAAGVLLIVQQLDGNLISPRILGSITGFSPAAVLLAVFIGAGLGGIGGMILALPVITVVRTLVHAFLKN